jgi:hypothetical protein
MLGVGAEDYVEYAHGTTRESAELIARDGLDEAAASRRSLIDPSRGAGSFFAARIQGSPASRNETIEYARAWAFSRRPGEACAVVVCKLPASVVEELKRQALLEERERPWQQASGLPDSE